MIDAQERLVGIIIHDDASDVLEVEATGTFRGGRDIAIVIALWMVVIVIVGSMVAMLLPFIVSRFRMDPSTACAPLVTSIPDVTGVLIYFSIEKAILSLP
ncbi:MAG TPA: magnesium transporter [Xanthobacteraceae bacterium]|nr:magnesium transporter [Xanthobacteraceae bacterium]